MNESLLNINGISCAATNAGIKNDGVLDLSVISFVKGTTTAAVFTQNIFCAAPVLVAKNHLQSDVRALVINSGNANAGTGVASGSVGLENAYKVCQLVAHELNVNAEQVLPFSTGVIGQQLDLSKFEVAIVNAVNGLSNDNLDMVATSILSTDLVQKYACEQFEVNGKTITISGIAKGSGMIRPDMATMLSFIFTDIKATAAELQTCLHTAVNQSFNRITVDGDTSTNDACTLSATAMSGVDLQDCISEFQRALNAVTKSLAHQIVKDGEGATKFVEVCVKGGVNNADCLEVAYTVAHSPLVKTALFASDANWGRILAAVGRANIRNLKAGDVSIYLGNVCLIKNGEIEQNYTEAQGMAQMAKTDIVINIYIGDSALQESVWTTDLSYEYIKINAEYRT